MLLPGGKLRYDFASLPVGPSSVNPFAQDDARGNRWAPGVLVLPPVVQVWWHWKVPPTCQPLELDGEPQDLEVDGEGRALSAVFQISNEGAAAAAGSLFLQVPVVG